MIDLFFFLYVISNILLRANLLVNSMQIRLDQVAQNITSTL